MKINYNIPALRTLNQLGKANDKAATAMERLSSGLRINRSADDAAGLAIANKLDAQVKGLQQANRNTMDGISFVQTAEGTLNEVHAMLQRMRELSVQASNGSYTEDDLEQMQQEINQLCEEINRLSQDTEFNEKSLLKGDLLKKTGFTFEQIYEAKEGEMNPDGENKAQYQIGIPEAFTKEEIESLLQKGFTVDGQTVEFYNGEEGSYTGKGIGVDISEVLKETDPTTRGDKLTDSITKALEQASQDNLIDVDVERNGSSIKLTAKEEGSIGNYIQNKDQGIVDKEVTLQIGSNEDQTMKVTIGNMSASALGLTGKPGEAGFTAEANVIGGGEKRPNEAAISVRSNEDASNAIAKIDNAVEMVSSQRAALGAVQNRLEHTAGNLGVSEENMTSSLSRIQDADMAYEMAQFTQQNVISQAATAMLAQANQRPQQVMQLLQR